MNNLVLFTVEYVTLWKTAALLTCLATQEIRSILRLLLPPCVHTSRFSCDPMCGNLSGWDPVNVVANSAPRLCQQPGNCSYRYHVTFLLKSEGAAIVTAHLQSRSRRNYPAVHFAKIRRTCHLSNNAESRMVHVSCAHALHLKSPWLQNRSEQDPRWKNILHSFLHQKSPPEVIT